MINETISLKNNKIDRDACQNENTDSILYRKIIMEVNFINF